MYASGYPSNVATSPHGPDIRSRVGLGATDLGFCRPCGLWMDTPGGPFIIYNTPLKQTTLLSSNLVFLVRRLRVITTRTPCRSRPAQRRRGRVGP